MENKINKIKDNLKRLLVSKWIDISNIQTLNKRGIKVYY